MRSSYLDVGKLEHWDEHICAPGHSGEAQWFSSAFQSASFCSDYSCELCEKPLQGAYKSSLVFVSRGGGAACAVPCVTARSGTDWCSESRVWMEQGSASICMVSWILFLLGQALSVNHFFPTISFFLLWFFPALTFLRASSISSHRAAGAVLLQSCRCYREAVATTLNKSVFHNTLEVYFKSFFFFPVTTQSLNYSVVFSVDSKHQLKARAA